jgi:hypothetical protein
MVTYTWTLPATVSPAGAKGKLTITASAGDQDVFAPGFSVSGALVHCTGITNTPSYGTGCADGDHAAVAVSLQPNETKTVTQEFLIQGDPGKVTITTTAPQNVVYTYSAGSPSGGTPPPPPVLVPAAPAFDQPETVTDPPPGGSALVTSPALAAFGVVTAGVSGVSQTDLLIAAARHECFVNFTKNLFDQMKRTGPSDLKELAAEWQANMIAMKFQSDTPESFPFRQLAQCVAFVDAVEAVLKVSPSADIASASCPAMAPIKLSISGSGAAGRLRSFHIGSANDKHEPLRVSCTRRAASLAISVAARSKHASLRTIVGPRLRIGIVRSRRDAAGGQLSVTFHHR